MLNHALPQTTNNTTNHPASRALPRKNELQIVPVPNQLSSEIKFFSSMLPSAQWVEKGFLNLSRNRFYLRFSL